ncbi:uncharacterized protein LOC109815744 isoform X1 [Cajanus cajan]|uniref:uncharacterized protein LOC109815744 isoform X1 n=1 Tax=Cajanus cajan TaxID=3821 RepID=UPI00098DA303|nr:uncharacterized protein LOC109815744 isoform X1 [Cajanus cajan]
MASATPKPQKRLTDFLKEQQEPFILELFLPERGYSKRWSLNGDSETASKKKRALLPFYQLLKALYNKLAIHKETKNILSKVHDQRNNHEALVDHIVQFSSHRSSDTDEEGTSILSREDQHLFYSHTLCNMGPHRRQRQRCIEGGPELLRKIPGCRVPNVREDVRRMQQRIRSCGVILPKNIREDSLLSAAIWSGLLDESITKGNCTRELGVLLRRTNDVSRMLKSKRVLHRIKKMVFDCVKDIAITLPTEEDRTKSYKQVMGPPEIRQRTKEWDQQAFGGGNRTNLLTLDYLNSIMEWSNFEPHVKDISVEITDAILDNIKIEIVIEMIGTMTPITPSEFGF